jgi:hypothetical protein
MARPARRRPRPDPAAIPTKQKPWRRANTSATRACRPGRSACGALIFAPFVRSRSAFDKPSRQFGFNRTLICGSRELQERGRPTIADRPPRYRAEARVQNSAPSLSGQSPSPISFRLRRGPPRWPGAVHCGIRLPKYRNTVSMAAHLHSSRTPTASLVPMLEGRQNRIGRCGYAALPKVLVRAAELVSETPAARPA